MREQELQAIEAAESIQAIARSITRYRVINLQSYLKYGTIEFRQHGGTVEFEKIMNWVRITQALVATAAAKKLIKKERPARANPTMSFNKEIGIFNTAQGIYVRNRRAHFRKLQEAAIA